MSMLFSTAVRNRIIRNALVAGGREWISLFLPLRFTKYITRGPFLYPKAPIGLASDKLRTAGKGPLKAAWGRIKDRDFFGWDPFGLQPPPRKLEDWWMARNRSRYGDIRNTRFLIGGTVRKARKDIRRWAKQRIKEYVANMIEDDRIMPLVREGDLRDVFSKAASARATSTTKRARLKIVIPRANRVNARVGRTLSTLPYWEFDVIRRTFKSTLDAEIADRFMAAAPVPTQQPQGVAAGFLARRQQALGDRGLLKTEK